MRFEVGFTVVNRFTLVVHALATCFKEDITADAAASKLIEKRITAGETAG
jgi:hypothetical protein